MSVRVILGDFAFAGYEVPERIPFGSSQHVNTHVLVGGARIIDAMGATQDDITWSGWFTDASALARARQLETMAKSGQQVPLTWDALAYTVLVREVKCDYRLPWRISYSITCSVVSDDAAPLPGDSAPSATDLVGDDMTGVATNAASIGDPTLATLVSATQAAIAAVGDFASAPASSVSSLLTPISAAQAQAGTLLAANTATLAGAAGIAGVVSGGEPVSMAATLLSQSGAALSAPLIISASNALGRMAANVAQANSGTTIITTVGGDLAGIAARQYGDALDWTAIAQANGLTDPALSGINTLVIPPAPANDSGGILNA